MLRRLGRAAQKRLHGKKGNPTAQEKIEGNVSFSRRPVKILRSPGFKTIRAVRGGRAESGERTSGIITRVSTQKQKGRVITEMKLSSGRR